MNKKLKIGVLLASVCVTALMQGCKKGDDDPFFSMRSRKGRLCGEWKLSESENRTTTKDYIDSTTITNDQIFNGTQMFRVSTAYSSSDTTVYGDTVAYENYLNFEKDGTYSWTSIATKTLYNGIQIRTEEVTEGNWQFTNKNTTLGLKKKEAIVLSPTKSSSTSGPEVSTNFNGNSNEGTIWYIQELRNKKIVLFNTSESDDASQLVKNNTKYIFLPKK